jgi:hypothetical protein
MLRRLLALRFRRIDWPWPCIELANEAGDGFPVWPFWPPLPPKESDPA